VKTPADLPLAQRIGAVLAGAPLDLIKLAAAAAMVVDHTNTSLFGDRLAYGWYIGRAALPLFMLAIAIHLARDTRPYPYIERLIILAVASQVFYTAAIPGGEPDAVFTLAAGSTVAVALAPRTLWLQHGVFVAGMIVVFLPALHPHAGLDYGIAGTLFPAVLLLATTAPQSHLLWLLPYAFALNYFYDAQFEDDVIAFLVITAGGGAIVLLSLLCRGRERFLPRYAFYAFYPGHLLLLALIRAIWVSGAAP
jgi:hypothetical protein